MSVLQDVRQVAHVLKSAAWPEGAAEVIVGDRVFVSASEPDDLQKFTYPLLVVRPGEWQGDPENPDLGTQKVSIVVVSQVFGDPFGQQSLIGGPRGGDTSNYGKGSSKGRGVLEIEPPITQAFRALTYADGLAIVSALESAGAPAIVSQENGPSVIARPYTLSIRSTLVDVWPAPSNFLAPNGVGQIACTWDLPPARYDRRAMVLNYLAGATAPSTPTAGTVVSIGSDLGTSKTITGLAAGTYSLAIWCGYNPNGRSANEHHSSQEVGTTRLSVTVS